MKLWDFLDKKVRVTTTDGETYTGLVRDFESAADSDEELDCIGLQIPGETAGAWLTEKDIETITEIK